MTHGEHEEMLASGSYSEDSREDKSAIRCIFFSEFHHIAGPKITCQVPDNYVSKDIFDNVSVYIIPKAQLQRSTITVTLRDCKILGFPVKIDDKKYARNAFYFNLCFVCDAEARTVHYEPVVKKMSDFLMALEVENCFLSSVSEDKCRLSEMLRQVMNDLNTHKMCILTEGTMTTHLKVVRLAAEPKPVLDHQVPIFLEGKEAYCSDQWDLTTQQVLPYIDGFNHVARIAAEADVENNLVKSCVQNLVYYGVVTLIPIFQYSNVYATTPKLKELAEDYGLQQRSIAYASKSPRQPAYLRDIYRMYASMTHGTSMRDLCQRLNPQNLRINERRLVQFGLIEALIRRVYRYPIYIKGTCGEMEEEDDCRSDSIYKYFTGSYSLDEICCTTGQSAAQIEETVEKDPNVVMLWK
ncbi:GATOR complex protein NPRL2 isoform X1 [Diachasma alloeum]|uniref:GATOR complex protein NPRL2 isoform X1 n=1 Tax=Diachasma alloeum TaxID=454923 RepID=UPI0007381409|nr:GATOR complex protein NPRL2 isoform X1 [Diachasma alloeum]XP_015115033.1 GATOR complex protein NPRL2 isoform X1 [Diachasma alloeum]XP_015115034.1 GATOR complex protein NPRL2 isoform X1 [Diachasma alloeum]XP_015115035.1 GATOR complex protein NPRL2 isoform X1 [Diachasma alloeum]XP_015115036.1 GATOR complex protein NPRL2 isoform X2 [Diachasma alloeum]XP_028982047.1 GATOR complex protein NPRL2 isoform X1 [Diachasma alloeum]